MYMKSQYHTKSYCIEKKLSDIIPIIVPVKIWTHA